MNNNWNPGTYSNHMMNGGGNMNNHGNEMMNHMNLTKKNHGADVNDYSCNPTLAMMNPGNMIYVHHDVNDID